MERVRALLTEDDRRAPRAAKALVRAFERQQEAVSVAAIEAALKAGRAGSLPVKIEEAGAGSLDGFQTILEEAFEIGRRFALKQIR